MEKKYFIASGKEKLGAFTISQLQEKGIHSDTFIWCEGMEQWTKAGEIEELKSIILPAPPPTPFQINDQEEQIEKKIKHQIEKKLLLNAFAKSKKAIFFLLAVFMIFFFFIDNSKIVSGAGIYVTDYDETQLYAILIYFSQYLFLSLILYACFYIIEKQKSYKGLLTLHEQAEIDAYSKIVEKQEEKYHYDVSINNTPTKIGMYLFFVYAIVGFFPEIMLIKNFNHVMDMNEEIRILFFSLSPAIRILAFSWNFNHLKFTHRKKIWNWVAFFFPAITLIIHGSLYPRKIEGANSELEKEKEELKEND